LARPIGVVRGAPAYVNVIATILQVCPDFTVTVAEHAATGDFTFIRWVATNGTGRAFRVLRRGPRADAQWTRL